MIISRTPFRVSFFGGGTDYPLWYRKHGGAVIGTTIDKYCYLLCRRLPPFFDHRIRITYTHIELCKQVSEIRHPSVREVLNHMQLTDGIEIHHVGDLPARTGIGSSSSFTVGLLHALTALEGNRMSKRELMNTAIDIEQNKIKEAVGSQDQAFAAFGGFKHITFEPNGEITVTPVIIPSERIRELEDHLMLFYTGVSRMASQVAEKLIQGMGAKEKQLKKMRELVDEAHTILTSRGDLTDFGKLLDESWMLKRGLAEEVSTSAIDQIYSTAKGCGAIGGKLLGAGGGGFLLLFVPPSRQKKLKEALAEYLHVPFRFETSGSQIVVYEPDIIHDTGVFTKIAPPISSGPL